MATQQEQFLDAYRVGLESMIGFAGTVLNEAERLRTRQLEAIRKALGEHAELAKGVASATTLNDLVAAHTRFANQQWELALGFWSRQFEAAGAALGGSAQISQHAARMAETQIATATAGVREAADRARQKIA